MLRSIILAATASLGLVACADMGMRDDMGGARPMAMRGGMTPTDRMGFTQRAASSDLFEIQSSQIALSRSQTPPIRQFAQMMINDHTRMSQQLMAAAQASGVPPMTPRLLPPHAAMLRRLQMARNFDNAYAREQVAAHQMALRLHQNYAARGDAPALRSVASAAVPVVSQHLQMARSWPRM